MKTDKPVSALSEELGACVKIKKKEERGKNEEKQKKKDKWKEMEYVGHVHSVTS